MKEYIKCLIDDLKGNPFGVIMILLFGGLLYNMYFEDTGSSYSEEDWAEYAEEQMIEDHLKDLEYQEREREMNTLYYIDNGYYLHQDINCKGLNGYSDEDINKMSVEDSYDYKDELSPCNWCVKGSN